MNDPVKSGSIEFRPRARLLKLIGEELISDEVVAITELVKNAHDADASSVVISFTGVAEGDGEIIVSDDGTGMSLETLLGSWMEPAGSTKTAGQRTTAKGRRVLGEKGVGRFAADKIGSHLELISRQKGGTTEVHASFDWDSFNDESMMLDQVKNRWEVRPSAPQAPAGTTLRITGLRMRWTERLFRRLITRLSRLQSPFSDRHQFKIRIDSDEFPDYAGEVAAQFIEKAPYKIDVSFDGREDIEFVIDGERTVMPVANGPGTLTCGPVRTRIYAFDLETDAVSRIGPRAEVRAWIREWSGVSIYRDGFRVWPYGEPHDDWLRLDQRRVNNPVLRLSNNQVIGFVEISSDRNPDLKDQTNREGLVANQSLADLRKLMHHVLQHLEAKRQTLRHPVSKERRTRKAVAVKDPLLAQLDQLVSLVPASGAKAVRRFTEQLQTRLTEEQQSKSKLIQGFSEMASGGQAAQAMTATLQSSLKLLHESVEALRKSRVAKGNPELLEKVSDAATHIDEISAMYGSSAAGSARKRKRTLDLAAEIRAVEPLLLPLFEEHDIRLDLDIPTDSSFRSDMDPVTFRRLMLIFVNNSVEWTDSVSDACIKMRLRVVDGFCELTFSDNGPGIPSALAEKIFDPMFSTKSDGMGTGLTIARSIVEGCGGTVEVIEDGRRRGANFRIRLPLRRSRAVP
jgi:hypothetical protein